MVHRGAADRASGFLRRKVAVSMSNKLLQAANKG